MTDRERIEAACQSQGLTIDGWDESGEDGLTAKLGSWVAIADDPHEMFFDGDEGDLTACVVGSEKYGNTRVYFQFLVEGTDSPWEVRDLTGLEANV